ncbi:hypothetical protein ACFX5U_10290 [Sphingobacterium sp. SG20118]|uniref:hypothetical protein n=1 Tax=Sphingobacterium sp. SG20118 TaxID=3367156 RepID=UPI0037DFC1ED
MLKSKIIGTGAHIPSRKISNKYFLNHTFFGPDQIAIEQSAETIIRKFKAITGIENRWYAPEGMTASEMGNPGGGRSYSKCPGRK